MAERLIRVMRQKSEFTLALFYCQNTPRGADKERQALEREYGCSIRLFPLPCGGRMEPIHFLKALEGFADAAYLITCPEGACRYSEGNTRARKRMERTAEVLGTIGLEKERIGIVVRAKDDPRSLAGLVVEIMNKVMPLGPSPVLNPNLKGHTKKSRKKTRASGSRRSRETGGAGEMIHTEQR